MIDNRLHQYELELSALLVIFLGKYLFNLHQNPSIYSEVLRRGYNQCFYEEIRPLFRTTTSCIFPLSPYKSSNIPLPRARLGDKWREADEWLYAMKEVCILATMDDNPTRNPWS